MSVSYTHLDVYKRQTSENWSIMIPVTDDEAARYQEEIGEDSDSFVLHVKFRKDDTETNATTYICLLYTSRCV